eukprot:g14580.t1
MGRLAQILYSSDVPPPTDPSSAAITKRTSFFPTFDWFSSSSPLHPSQMGKGKKKKNEGKDFPEPLLAGFTEAGKKCSCTAVPPNFGDPPHFN